MTTDVLFKTFPVLETRQFMLREIELNDAESILAIWGDPAVMAYMDILPLQSLDEARNLIRQMHGWYARREAVRWGIARKGEEGCLLGTLGFHHFDGEKRRAEIGYDLRSTHWRQGIMREALTEMLTYGFATLALNRIEAVVDDDNEKSKALLRSLGFEYEGCLRKRFWHDGGYRDEHYFGMLTGDWLAQES